MELTVGHYITIGIFVLGLAISFFKYQQGVVVALKGLTEKFDERTMHISKHLSKIDKTLEGMSENTARISALEQDVADHEGRLRILEHRRRAED